MQINPLRPLGLDHVVLRVRDMPLMIGFYEAVLGCRVERTTRGGLVQMRAGRSLIDLLPRDSGEDFKARGVMDHFCLALRTFDDAALRAHLAGHGVEILDSGVNYGADGNGPFLYIRDPEGNDVELKGPSAMPVAA